MKRFKTDKVEQHEVDHNKTVRELASECALFLKRSDDFPIAPCSVNLYGSGARRTVKGGKGSGDVNTRYNVSIEQGLKNAGFEVTTTAWMDSYDHLAEQSVKDWWDGIIKEAEAGGFSPYVLLMTRPKPVPEYDFALSEKNNLNIYVIARDSTEGLDRENKKGDYLLLDSEIRDIKYLASKKEKFLLVLNVGGVLDLSPVLNDVQNILLLSQLGAETGNIFADILTGKSVPSGKLTTTWAKSLADYPSTEWFGTHTEVDYKDGVYVGYRYFDSFGVKPQFPFGFGLGYTDFIFNPTNFDVKGNEVSVTVEVKNTGNHSGKETIQIYIVKPDGKQLPCKQLIAFGKTKMLKGGENQNLTITFDMLDAASFVPEQSAFVLQKGTYQIYAGNHIDNTVCACSVRIVTDFITESVHKLTCPKVEELQPPKAIRQVEKPLLGEKLCVPAKAAKAKQEAYKSKNIASMSNEQLSRLCVGVLNDMALDNNIGNSGKMVAGSAGETYSDETVVPLVLADGPAGLRISPYYRLDENGRVKASDSALAGMLPVAVKGIEIDDETYFQYCTAIPVGTALAQSWNIRLCEQIGDIVGKEMQLFGVDIWLAPALNIHRNPLCGRNFEYYSEDPLISGVFAAAITSGVQANKGCSVTIKHFCCNNQETDRFFSNSAINEYALREIYLKGFKICIEKSRPNAMMTSYNLINGTHAANHVEILQKILREEWNYEGLVMTDWMTTGGLGTGAKYGSSIPRECVIASNDLIMPGRKEDFDDIMQAVNAGLITRAQLEACANRVLYLSESKVRN